MKNLVAKVVLGFVAGSSAYSAAMCGKNIPNREVLTKAGVPEDKISAVRQPAVFVTVTSGVIAGAALYGLLSLD